MPPQSVEDQLSRILGTSTFRRAPRLSRFLTFVVRTSADGRSEEIKESNIGIEVFDRRPGFDPKVEPVVRVQARRLREKLDEYYRTTGANDAIVIEIPKGTYVPAIRTRVQEADARLTITPPVPGVPARPRPFPKLLLAGCGLAVAGLLIAAHSAFTARTGRQLGPLPQPEVLTSLPDIQTKPAFSPDGERVAFEWQPPGEPLRSIYTMAASGVERIRLAPQSKQDESSPVWSPDQKAIAFFRQNGVNTRTLIVRDLVSGRERSLGDVHNAISDYATQPNLDWSPDGKRMVICEQTSVSLPARAMLIDAVSGNRQPLTSPPVGTSGDIEVKFNPSGRRVAFRRGYMGQLWVGELSVSGELTERRLTADNSGVRGVSWIDEDTILYSTHAPGPHGDRSSRYVLAAIAADGRTSPRVVYSASSDVVEPSWNAKTRRLAAVSYRQNTDIVELGVDGQPVTLVSTPANERSARYSPGGDMLAFVSELSGTEEIWLAEPGGRLPRQLTHLQGSAVGIHFRWRPDGKAVVAHLRIAGNSDLYEIEIPGGNARRLTFESSRELWPAYSPDGRWIYFTSDRTGVMSTYRIPITERAGQYPAAELVSERSGIAALPFSDPDGVLIAPAATDGGGFWFQQPGLNNASPVSEVIRSQQCQRLDCE